jgi:hypothetical protein
MFPCPKCGPPASQVQSLYDYWVANGVNVTLLWLDIEGADYWLGDAGRNQVCCPHDRSNSPSSLQPLLHRCNRSFIAATARVSRAQAWYAQLFDACSSMGLDFGVYCARARLDLPIAHIHSCCAASQSQWSEIFGSSSFAHGRSVALWYAHYDVSPQTAASTCSCVILTSGSNLCVLTHAQPPIVLPGHPRIRRLQCVVAAAPACRSLWPTVTLCSPFWRMVRSLHEAILRSRCVCLVPLQASNPPLKCPPRLEVRCQLRHFLGPVRRSQLKRDQTPMASYSASRCCGDAFYAARLPRWTAAAAATAHAD